MTIIDLLYFFISKNIEIVDTLGYKVWIWTIICGGFGFYIVAKMLRQYIFYVYTLCSVAYTHILYGSYGLIFWIAGYIILYCIPRPKILLKRLGWCECVFQIHYWPVLGVLTWYLYHADTVFVILLGMISAELWCVNSFVYIWRTSRLKSISIS